MNAAAHHRLEGKRALVVGAAGGLGSAIAAELAARGATVHAGVRNPRAYTGGLPTLAIDLASPSSINAASERLCGQGAVPDFVVNAAGADVRKGLTEHSDEEIDRVLAIDLRGPILLTRALLPLMHQRPGSVIMHLGGFGDGRLAFPYYSVDVAARAGLRSFVESVNRESTEPSAMVAFFSPAVADTEAERPYHDLWRRLGVTPVPARRVASLVVEALVERREVTVMGRATRLFAALNAVAPRLAEAMLLRRYSRELAAVLGSTPR